MQLSLEIRFLTAQDAMFILQGRSQNDALQRRLQPIVRQKKGLSKKKIRELEDAKRCLAEMNAFEDVQDDEMIEENPQRLSAAVRKRAHVELEGNNDEEVFDFAEVDAMPVSSDVEELVEPKVN